MKILITGGTGFAGSHLVELLQRHGQNDVHVTAYKDAAGFVQDLVGEDHVHPLNLTDYEATKQLLESLRPDQIYHLASLASVGDSFDKTQFLLQMHTSLQLNLLEAVTQVVPHCRILSIGTALAYQRSEKAVDENSPLGPDNPYALSKLFQDLLSYTYTQSKKLDIVRARPFNHIGERQTPGFVVPDFAQQIIKIERGEQEKIQVGNLDAIRDFSDVKDVVAAYQLLMEKGNSGEAYNIGSGQGTSIQQVLQMLAQHSQVKIQISVDQSKIRPVDLKYLVCNNEKIKKLGWQPKYPLDQTLVRILDWWRVNS